MMKTIRRKSRTDGASFWKSRTGNAVIVALIGSVAAIFAAILPDIVNELSGKSYAWKAQIHSPKENEAVSNRFNVKGTLQGIPEGHHVWLAIRMGERLWPKAEIPQRDRSWLVRLHEIGSSGKSFDVVVFVVNEKGHRQVEDWFRESEEQGEYLGIKKLDEHIVLDLVSVRLRGK